MTRTPQTTTEVRTKIGEMVQSQLAPEVINESIVSEYGEEYRDEVYSFLEDLWVEQNS